MLHLNRTLLSSLVPSTSATSVKYTPGSYCSIHSASTWPLFELTEGGPAALGLGVEFWEPPRFNWNRSVSFVSKMLCLIPVRYIGGARPANSSSILLFGFSLGVEIELEESCAEILVDKYTGRTGFVSNTPGGSLSAISFNCEKHIITYYKELVPHYVILTSNNQYPESYEF